MRAKCDLIQCLMACLFFSTTYQVELAFSWMKMPFMRMKKIKSSMQISLWFSSDDWRLTIQFLCQFANSIIPCESNSETVTVISAPRLISSAFLLYSRHIIKLNEEAIHLKTKLDYWSWLKKVDRAETRAQVGAAWWKTAL